MDGTATLDEARIYLEDRKRDGVACPCCGQFVKLYRRTLTSSMVWALLIVNDYFARPGCDPWLHVEDYLKALPGLPAPIRGDFAKLRFWGFIEKAPGVRDDGSSRNGYYRITDAGQQFANGVTVAPAAVYIYNNEFYGYDDQTVHVNDKVAGFNFTDLMGGA